MNALVSSRGRLLLSAGLVVAVLVVGAVLVLRKRGADPAGAFIVKPSPFITEISKNEDHHDKVSGAVKGSFLKAVKERAWDRAQAALTDDFLGRIPEPGAGVAVPDGTMNIREYSGEGLKDLGPAQFIAALKSYVEPWTQVERTTWRSFTFLSSIDMKSAYAALHFQLAGPRPDGTREDFQANVEVELVDVAGTWKIRRFALLEGTRVGGLNPPWREITDETGFHFNESETNKELSQQGIDNRANIYQGSLTVADFNRDGFPDILASMVYKFVIFFMNDGQGGFTRVDLPVEIPEERALSYLYIDLDNDGVEELVDGGVLTYEGGKGRFGIYVNRGGKWERRDSALVFENRDSIRQLTVQQIVPCDVDKNGFLDLFFCCYSTNRSLKEDHNLIHSTDGADNFLFMNYGTLNLKEESDERGITGTQYTFVAKMFDFDRDGDEDIFEGNDYGRNVLWLNDGTGRFTTTRRHLFESTPNYTMGISMGDFDNDGHWSVYITNMYSHAGNRIVPLAGGINDELRGAAMLLATGNQLYEQDPATGAWKDSSIERRVNWGDWAWGTHFVDFDNDSDKEIFVTNGFTSNRDKSAPDY